VSVAQSDFFDPPGLVGLSQAEAIVTPGEERALVASIEGVELSPFRFHGWVRKTPDRLLRLALRIRLRKLNEFEQALVIRYDPGTG
jgi:hypothetical protein